MFKEMVSLGSVALAVAVGSYAYGLASDYMGVQMDAVATAAGLADGSIEPSELQARACALKGRLVEINGRATGWIKDSAAAEPSDVIVPASGVSSLAMPSVDVAGMPECSL